MKPYYEHAGITIYHGDCREIAPDDISALRSALRESDEALLLMKDIIGAEYREDVQAAIAAARKRREEARNE